MATPLINLLRENFNNNDKETQNHIQDLIQAIEKK